MYLSEYLERKKNAELITEPYYIPKAENMEEAIYFLKEHRGMPYPENWFYANPERTMSMYKKQYIKYWKEFLIAAKEAISAKKELQILEILKQQNKIIDDLEVKQEEHIYY